MGMGGESGNDKVNNIFNKGVTTEDVKYTSYALKEASKSLGVSTDYVLYMMYPTTTKGLVDQEQVFKDNVEFVKSISPTSVVISPLAAFYGADVFEKKEEYGITVDESYNIVMPLFEYTAYLPKQFWKKIYYSIENLSFDQIVNEITRFTKKCISEGILTDIADEQVILARVAGFDGKKGLADFYFKTLNDLVSCSQGNLKDIQLKFNEKSRKIALENF